MAGFVINAVVDEGPATILLVLVAAAFCTAAALTANTLADDVAELADADAVEVAAAAVPTDETATVVILCESSLCHLALL